MTDLHYLSATEALERFRSRELSPVELLDAVIARARRSSRRSTRCCHTFYDDARAQARAAEARYAGKGEPPRPLEGIPLALKEEEAVAGQPWTQGSLIYKDLVADHSSAFARRHLEAGAIVHARTTAPEFSCAGFTHSRLWGVTRNPWNPEYASAAPPAARLRRSRPARPRWPAARTSAARSASRRRSTASSGSSRPYGRVPVDPAVQSRHLLPLRAAGADRGRLRAVRERARRPRPVRHRLAAPEAACSRTHFDGVEGLRVALSLDLGDWPVDPEVRANTLAVGDALRAAGATVDEVDLEVPSRTCSSRPRSTSRLGFGDWVGSHDPASTRRAVTAYAVGDRALVRGGRPPGRSYFDGLEIEARLYAPVGALLEEYDALVCPTAGTRGLLAGDDYVGHGLEVGGAAARVLLRRPADAGLQRHEPLPRAGRAVGVRRQRRAHRRADRGAHRTTT